MIDSEQDAARLDALMALVAALWAMRINEAAHGADLTIEQMAGAFREYVLDRMVTAGGAAPERQAMARAEVKAAFAEIERLALAMSRPFG